MKNIFFLSLIALFSIIACSKDAVVDPDLHGFEFTALTSDLSRMSVNQTANLKAVAVGDGLTYTWQASEGNLIGQGAEIQFTICHATVSTIKCTVKDKYNHKTIKNIEIASFMPFVI
jgi:hypothetical protein